MPRKKTATASKMRAKAPPRVGTFAAWVVAQPVEESPSVTARRARAATDALGRKLFPKATPQAVYNARWYYGLVRPRGEGAGTPVLTDASVASRAARLASYRTRDAIVGAAPSDTASPEYAELLAIVTRHGTDAVRRVIERIERRSVDDVLASARRSA